MAAKRTKPQRGRPLLPESERLSKPLPVKLNDRQWATLIQRCNALNLTHAEFARLCMDIFGLREDNTLMLIGLSTETYCALAKIAAASGYDDIRPIIDAAIEDKVDIELEKIEERFPKLEE
jgi:hypothetical protein